MVGLGIGLRALAGPLGRHAPAACAVAMMLIGLLAVTGRVMEAPLALPGVSHAGIHGHR
jgi:hypothetical protein